jgi:hypothetical protein
MQKPDVNRMMIGIILGIVAITTGAVIVTVAIMKALG